jgi:hypothetical protein
VPRNRHGRRCSYCTLCPIWMANSIIFRDWSYLRYRIECRNPRNVTTALIFIHRPPWTGDKRQWLLRTTWEAAWSSINNWKWQRQDTSDQILAFRVKSPIVSLIEWGT